jgi:hypothetical protein
MPRYPEKIFVAWAGSAPPDWAMQGMDTIRRQFGGAAGRDLVFLYEPQEAANRAQTASGHSPDWDAALNRARQLGFTTERVTSPLADDAERTLQAKGYQHSAEFLRSMARVHLQHGNAIAVKDLAFKMAMAGRGGFAMDLTVSRRRADPRYLFRVPFGDARSLGPA